MVNLSNTWKDVKGYEGLYQVNAEGQIKSTVFKKERILNPTVNSAGYKIVSLTNDFGKSSRTVHSIVAETFLGHVSTNRKVVIDHVNNNPLDNRLANLQIISQRENCSKDKHRMNKSSQHVGVSYVSSTKKWFAHIRIGDKISLGTYSTESKAKEIRDAAVAIVNNPAIVDKIAAINELKAENKEPGKPRKKVTTEVAAEKLQKKLSTIVS